MKVEKIFNGCNNFCDKQDVKSVQALIMKFISDTEDEMIATCTSTNIGKKRLLKDFLFSLNEIRRDLDSYSRVNEDKEIEKFSSWIKI